MRIFAVMTLLVATFGCNRPDQNALETVHQAEALPASFDLQGHRGARGLAPENTIPSFIRALELGVTTLEMDVVISKDGRVVLSHEPWFAASICSMPDGSPISEDDERSLNMYEMTYEEIRQYDCGIRGNPRFPRQEKMAVSKPLLEDVFDRIEAFTASHQRPPVLYNIETKSRPETDDVYHPQPERFTRLVYAILEQKGLLARTTLQSFDERTLQVAHRIDPNLSLALLVGDHAAMDLDERIESLGFTPSIYSPAYTLVDASLIERAVAYGMRVIPWTVNTPEEMEELIELGVHGIITDYPDLGQKILTDRRNTRVVP